MTYQDFKNKYIDKSINVDGAYGAQCYDLAMAYMKEVWGIQKNLICKWSNGVCDFAEHFSEMFDTSKFDYTKNSPTNVPPQGAVFVFGNNKFGHTGIVDSADENAFTSLDQNWGAGVDGSGVGEKRIRLVTHNYQSMLGWITPKVQNNNQTNNNQSDMALIQKVKDGGFEVANYIKTNYPNYYNNWGRAIGNIDTLATENPYIWVREMADQVSWNYTANTEVDKLKKQINDDLLETGEVKRLNNELKDTNETLAKYNSLYLDETKQLKQEIASKDTKISELQEKLASAVTTPEKPPINSATKPFWQSKKVISMVGTIVGVFPAVLAVAPVDMQPYLILGSTIITSLYLFVQGSIDQQAMINQSVEAVQKFKKVSKVNL